MGKDKLRRFAEFKTFANTFDFPYELKGKWCREVFKNEYPIVLELGCGKGEYTVALGRKFTQKNFIGIDIKSNRMWKGAGIAASEGLTNVAFMRIVIDKIGDFFDKEEVSEIWITFPDPFPRGRHAKHRLTHPRFLKMYKNILARNGAVHLKTDDDDLFGFTTQLLPDIGISPLVTDWNEHENPDAQPHLKSIMTYYEQLFMARGRTIKYTRFTLEDYDEQKAVEWEKAYRDALKKQGQAIQ